jgi:hypothetical protein
MGTFMTASEFFTRTPRHSLGDSARRIVRRPALLGALVALVVLASCGKSTQTANPAPKSIGSTSGSTSGGTSGGTTVQAGEAGQAAGQPAAQFAFATSDLDLIKSTSGTNGWVTILAAQLKTPASKEVSLSASLEAGLYTQTLVSSKNLKKDTSTASVAIQVQALIDGQPMPPGTVTYAARTQTLSATLEGAIAGCLTTVTNADGTTSIILDPNCVTPETIELILTTLNAASFNFVASNVPVGTHTISLQARITSTTSVDTGTASATALVGKGTMVASIVRAVR